MKKSILIVLLILILLVVGVELIYYSTITECCSKCKDNNDMFETCPTVCVPCNRNFFEKIQILFREFFK